MKHLLACVWALMFLCTSTLAQTVTPVDPDRVDEFIEVIAKNECRIANAAAEIYLPAAGFPDRDEVRAIMARLLYFGRARLVETDTDGVLVVYDGPCPEGGPETDPKTLFLQVVANNGCSLHAIDDRPL